MMRPVDVVNRVVSQAEVVCLRSPRAWLPGPSHRAIHPPSGRQRVDRLVALPPPKKTPQKNKEEEEKKTSHNALSDSQLTSAR